MDSAQKASHAAETSFLGSSPQSGDIEIVQGYEGVKSGDTFLDRPRITVPKYKDNPLHSFIQPLQFNTYGYIE